MIFLLFTAFWWHTCLRALLSLSFVLFSQSDGKVTVSHSCFLLMNWGSYEIIMNKKVRMKVSIEGLDHTNAFKLTNIINRRIK